MQASRGLMRNLRMQVAPCRPCSAPLLRPARGSLLVVGAARPVEKLKRAPSAYNLFYRAKYPDVRSSLASKGIDITLATCASAIRELWSTTPAAQKAQYETEAIQIKADLEAARAAGTWQPPKPRKAKRTGPPRPMTAYAAFTKQEFAGFKALHPEAKVPEIAKMIGAKWASLPEAYKQTLKDKANKELDAYKLANPPSASDGAPAPAAAPKAAPKVAPKVKPTASTPATRAATVAAVRSNTPSAAPAPNKRTTPASVKAATPTARGTPVRSASMAKRSPPK